MFSFREYILLAKRMKLNASQRIGFEQQSHQLFFSSQDVVAAFSIFNPTKTPAAASSLWSYGEDSTETSMDHYGVKKGSPDSTR